MSLRKIIIGTAVVGALGIAALVSGGCTAEPEPETGKSLVIASQERGYKFTEEGKDYLEQIGVSIVDVDSYDVRFINFGLENPLRDILRLRNEGITEEEANKAHKDLTANDLIKYNRIGRTIEEVNAYMNSRFRGFFGGMDRLLELGIPEKKASEFDERYDANDVLFFLRKGPDAAKIANAYHKSFSAYESRKLYMSGIDPSVANPYGELNERFCVNIDANDVIRFESGDYSFKEVEEMARKEGLRKAISE